jgi:hypothetical protein
MEECMSERIAPAALDWTALREQYRRDGIVKLGGLLDPSMLAECRRCYDWSLANPSPIAQVLHKGTQHQHYVDNSNEAAIPMYRALVRHPVFADSMANLLESEHIWYYSEEVFARRGGISGRTGWHQDFSYAPWGGRQWANFWLSFETLPAKNSIEVVRGSHRGPLYDGTDYRSNPDEPPVPLHGGQWPPLPDIERERAARPGSWDVVSYATKPGDVIALHPRALHGGGPVDEETPDRSTLVLRFFGDDAVFEPLPYGTEYYIKGKAIHELHYGGLKAGDPLRSVAFEQIR